MKQKAKILAAIAVLSLALIPIAKTQAAVNWADYFTRDEAKSIKKMVDKYIRNQIENDSDKWDGVINKDTVDNSIAKRKVYTGTIACDDTAYDIKNGTGISTVYWKEISVPELNINDVPQITFFDKDNDKSYISDDLWEFADPSSVRFTDGAVYVLYGFQDPIDCDTTDGAVGVNGYKISISY